jgi:hypothetical protein
LLAAHLLVGVQVVGNELGQSQIAVFAIEREEIHRSPNESDYRS